MPVQQQWRLVTGFVCIERKLYFARRHARWGKRDIAVGERRTRSRGCGQRRLRCVGHSVRRRWRCRGIGLRGLRAT